MSVSQAADVEALWGDLVAAAVLGTERQPPPLAPTGTPLDGPLAALAPAEPEARLLGAAAAVALYRRAGRRRAATGELPAAAPPDDRPPCCQAASDRLAAMLAGVHADLIDEWLDAVAGAGRRVDPRHLPALLGLAARRPELRGAVAAAAGERGAWLAARNPDWAPLLAAADGPIDESHWQTGERAVRLALLGRLRVTDPARGRALVESTWAEDPPEARAAFVDALAEGLSMADEPFLEAALDDRRKEVREAAAALLARLPESRLVRRMTDRIAPRLRWNRGLRLLPGGAGRIDVDPPEAFDKAMARDGVEAKAPRGERLGERAWWLRRMLAAVPPATWSRTFGAEPAQLIEAARKSDWPDALLVGWAEAAVNHRDAAWAQALLEAPRAPDATMEALVALLPPPRREALALGLLRSNRGPLRGDHPALLVLRHCRHGWSAELGRAVLDRLRDGIAANDQRFAADWHAQAALKELARRIPPALADEAAAGWPTASRFWQWWAPRVEELAATLRFRRDMLEEVSR